MKKFRLLAAMVITVAMLFTVAFAADITFDAIEYNGTDDTVTVAITADRAMEIEMFSTFGVSYDSSVFEVASQTSSYAAAEMKDLGTFVTWSNAVNCNIAEGDALYTIVFNVKDKAAAVGKAFAIDEGNTMMFETDGNMADFSGSVTVTGATPDPDPVAPTYTEGVATKVALEGASGEVYTGIWTNDYTVTLNDNVAKFVKLAITGKGADEAEATKDFAIASNTAGEGTIAFKVAVFGLVEGAGVPSIAETEGEWVAAELAE